MSAPVSLRSSLATTSSAIQNEAPSIESSVSVTPATTTPSTQLQKSAQQQSTPTQPEPHEVEVVNAKNQVFALILNDDAQQANYETLNAGTVDLGNLILRDTKKNSVVALVKNNPQRYTFETRNTTLYIYENTSIKSKLQGEPTPLSIPFTPDITRIRIVEIYPTLEYQNVQQTVVSSTRFY